MSFAEELYRCKAATETAEDELVGHILGVLGIPRTEHDSWPFDDTSYDSYDLSFELHNVKRELELTPDQQGKFWDLGFDCCWLNYADGFEMYYSKLCRGSLKDPAGDFATHPPTAEPAEEGGK